MLSNTCEDKHLSNDITSYHEAVLEKIGMPEWVNIKCPFCGKEMPLRSIRSISIKLNARNFGDVAVELLCCHCCKMDTVYFPRSFKDINDFVELLKGNRLPPSSPLVEEDMYKASYNNTIESMMRDRG